MRATPPARPGVWQGAPTLVRSEVMAVGHSHQLFLFLPVCFLTQDISLLAPGSEPSTLVSENMGPSRQTAQVCGGGRPLGRWGSGESDMDWPEAGTGTGNPRPGVEPPS